MSTKKTKHLGLESGKSSSKYFTPNPQPYAGSERSSVISKAIKVIFRTASGKKIR